MNITEERTVREIAVEQPSSIRVFERFGIDYCCGGRKPLSQACDELQNPWNRLPRNCAKPAA